MWTLDEGLKLVRALQPTTRKYGYHLTLGGSVLNDGSSKKDLDLYFIELDNKKIPSDHTKLVAWLTSLWGKANPINGQDYDPVPQGEHFIEIDQDAIVEQALFNAPIPEPPRRRQDVMIDWHQEFPVPRDPAFGINNPAQFQPAVEYRANPAQQRFMEAFDKVAKPSKSYYKFKLKFIRPTGDRIDVFVL